MVYQEEPLGGLCVDEGARVPAPFELRRGSKTSLGFAGRKPWATGPTTGGGGDLPSCVAGLGPLPLPCLGVGRRVWRAVQYTARKHGGAACLAASFVLLLARLARARSFVQSLQYDPVLKGAARVYSPFRQYKPQAV